MRYIVEERDGLIVVRVPEGATDEALDGDSLYTQVEAILAVDARRYLLLHDLRGTPRSSVRRRRFTEWVSANEQLIETRIRAYAIVAGSALLEGMITAVLWVMSPPIQWRTFSDPREAEQWLWGLP
ncbi:MAG: STAS/SEC14 domain-containing protein [Sandaracinaceae bacterium]